MKNYLIKYGIWFVLIGLVIIVVFNFLPGKNTGDSSRQHPNILLITIDTLRADHLSIYGFPGHTTKNIDALARDGVVFDSAYCDVNWTTPSMASTLTGTYANRHGLQSIYQNLPDSAETAAEFLKSAGYSTAAVIAAFPLDSIYNLDQGFDVYNDTYTVPIFIGSRNPPREVQSRWGKTIQERKQMFFKKIVNKSRRWDNEVTEEAVGMLKRFKKENQPFFLWVHYFGPHGVPDLRLGRLENWKSHAASYAGKVLETDKEVGKLLTALDSYKLSSQTLVILHADHGESLWEHGFVGHGVYLYENNLHVPLIMRWPGKIPQGQRVSQLVGNVDIAPTILEAAGFQKKAMANMDGKSLFPVIHNAENIHPSLYFETYLCAHDLNAEIVEIEKGKKIKVGIRSYGVLKKPWKYIKTEFFPIFEAPNLSITKEIQARVEKRQLFNLEKDPAELHSMARTAQGNILIRDLKNLLSKFTSAEQGRKKRMKLTDEQLEKLRSLGYVE